ncbi:MULTISPECIES: phage tail protein [unclassified Pseudomonas]|uniref:phage tail-collar fiber domain-containing protein n=1 Tax=unclassified Pseudomonas TaxID=196821 RepID=UPI000A1E1B50|nr:MULTISPECIES: phage tail protein [unclassified Pseudomonas]
MIDSNSQFFAILTAVGEAKQANATALGIPWTFKEMAVGDANGTDPVPDKTQTKLINEWRRAPVNQVRTDPATPNLIITEQVIPSDVGGRWIREVGLYDAAGDLVAVANCAPSFKPLLAQGTGKTQIIRMNFIVSNTAQIVLKIDPAVVLATRQYVDDSLATALPANKTPGTYRQVTIDKRGIVLSGANPTTLAGYGITDAFTKPETAAAINQAVAALVAASPGALDTLKELADALGNDPNFATTMTNALAGKAAKATTLAGYGITDAMKKFAGGIEAQAVPSSNNLDTVSSSGLNSFHALTANRPAGSTYGTVLHISYDQPTGNWTQFAVSTGDSRAWFRGSVNGSIQGWQEVWSSANLNPGNLQPKLGFAPVQQGTGIGQLTNAIKIGWNATDLKATVDTTDLGAFLLSSNCELTGAIVYFFFNAPPAGFLRANGAAVSRTTYARLFARIGVMYGAGDGSTTFNLPDMRGVFLRGFDDGRGIDPGRGFSSLQLDQVQGHAHGMPSGSSGFTVYAGGIGGASSGGGINTAPATGGVVSDGISGTPRVGSETRPVNIALLACIKY